MALFLANAKFAISRFCVERFPIFIGLFKKKTLMYIYIYFFWNNNILYILVDVWLSV